jgi:hypothetical protein
MSQLQVNRINDASGGVIAPISSVMRNRIINGQMTLNQRGFSGSNSNNTYTLDRWVMQGGVDNKFTVAQSSTAPTGFSNSLLVTSSSAYSVPSGEYYTILQKIEGFNAADLAFGTASAKTVTLSFWVRSSLTGTFGGALANSANNRSYPFTYTINAANTWEYETITIAGDISGTWIGATNGIGLNVIFGLGAGSTFSGTAGAWAGSDFRSATGATSVVATNGATFYITGVQLEVGTQATSFEYRQYTTELQLAQRYYARMGGGGYSNFCCFVAGLVGSATAIEGYIKYPVTMRAAATLNFSNVRTNTGVGTNAAITSLGSVYAGTDSMNAVFISSGSNMTTGQGGTIIGNNNSSAYIELSAEL